jgi:elongation factor G
MGSAYKNKGIQLLLDAVNDLLPCPSEVENTALDMDRDEAPVILSADPAAPLVALAFKLEDRTYGQLTYLRVYQGSLSKGEAIVNVRTGRKIKVGRLVRMHADQMEEIDSIPAGYIGALFGIDCASGDTFVAPGLSLTMTSMYVPKPVISLAIHPKDHKSEINMSKALNRFTKEDPTFKTHVSRDQRNHHLGDGRAAPGGLHRAHAPGVRRRGRRRGAARGLPRDHHPARRLRLPAQETDRRLGPVRPGGRLDGADRRRGLRVRQQVVGGSIPTQFITACEKGFPTKKDPTRWLRPKYRSPRCSAIQRCSVR